MTSRSDRVGGAGSPAPPTTTVAASALELARRGRPVLPCAPRDKRPLTTHGLLDATIDPRVISRWFERWPEANVAMRTGRESGLVVLDVDGDVGAESLRELEREHGELPRTVSVCTPRGGQHFYFAHPHVSDVPNSAGRIGTGIDIRGENGFVLVPPSVGANGRRYEIDENRAMAPMPTWLLQLASAPVRRSPEPLEGGEYPLTPSGERHDTLVRFAGALRAMGLREETIVECGRAFLRHQVEIDAAKPIDLRHAERTCRSIARRYPPHPNWDDEI
jgi:putative DNA primase/helicase